MKTRPDTVPCCGRALTWSRPALIWLCRPCEA